MEAERHSMALSVQAGDVRTVEAMIAARLEIASDLDWLRAQHAAGKLVNPVRWDGGGLFTVAVNNDRPR